MPAGIHRSRPQGVIAITDQSWPGLLPVRKARATAKFVLSDPSERAEKLALKGGIIFMYCLPAHEIKYNAALRALKVLLHVDIFLATRGSGKSTKGCNKWTEIKLNYCYFRVCYY
jgi:hypothetical protein